MIYQVPKAENVQKKEKDTYKKKLNWPLKFEWLFVGI
jgi:hypothetical protein